MQSALSSLKSSVAEVEERQMQIMMQIEWNRRRGRRREYVSGKYPDKREGKGMKRVLYDGDYGESDWEGYEKEMEVEAGKDEGRRRRRGSVGRNKKDEQSDDKYWEDIKKGKCLNGNREKRVFSEGDDDDESVGNENGVEWDEFHLRHLDDREDLDEYGTMTDDINDGITENSSDEKELKFVSIPNSHKRRRKMQIFRDTNREDDGRRRRRGRKGSSMKDSQNEPRQRKHVSNEHNRQENGRRFYRQSDERLSRRALQRRLNEQNGRHPIVVINHYTEPADYRWNEHFSQKRANVRKGRERSENTMETDYVHKNGKDVTDDFEENIKNGYEEEEGLNEKLTERRKHGGENVDFVNEEEMQSIQRNEFSRKNETIEAETDNNSANNYLLEQGKSENSAVRLNGQVNNGADNEDNEEFNNQQHTNSNKSEVTINESGCSNRNGTLPVNGPAALVEEG